MITKLMTATVGAMALLGIGAASAVPVSFSSNGTFSNVTGCGDGFPSCSISNSGNVLDMSGSNNSTLTANDFGPYAFNTNAMDVTIGQITWVNNASGSFFFPTDQNFNVNYSLVLTFTAPNADTANQTFNLVIKQPTNPPGDTVNGFNIVGLPATFNLGGVSVTDIRFSEIGSGSFANGLWSNPEGSTSQLRLTADFTAVPEPASLALLGAGLFGLGVVRRRRNRTAA